MNWGSHEKNPVLVKSRQRKIQPIVIDRVDLVQAGYVPAKDESRQKVRYFRPPVSEIQQETARMERNVEKEFDQFLGLAIDNPEYYGVTPETEQFMIQYYQAAKRVLGV